MTDAAARFAVGARSHAGMVRTNNEDAFVADAGVFVVADGMGGHQAGEVASALAVDTLKGAHATGFVSVTDLERAVRDANSAIRMHAAESAERAGMGTTLTGLVALEPHDDDPTPRLAVANVGDSRTYLHRDHRLVRLTVDHSYVQELVRTGQITEQEARFHPRRNIVTRALGIDHNIAVDAWVRSCVRGDRYLVCSDGLVDEVPDHEIAAVLDGVADPQVAADQLVEMANRHGGRDNVTVIVVDVLDGLDSPPADDVLPAGAVDDGDLPSTLDWADGPGVSADTTRVMPAQTAPATQVLPVTSTASVPSSGPSSTTAAIASRPRFGLPQLLFLVALGAILTVVIVVVVLATQDDPVSPVDTPTTGVVTTVVSDATTVTTPTIAPTSPVTVSPSVSTTPATAPGNAPAGSVTP